MIYRILVDHLYYTSWISKSYLMLSDKSLEALDGDEIPVEVLTKLAFLTNKEFPTEDDFGIVLEKTIGKRSFAAYAPAILARLEKGYSEKYDVAIPWKDQKDQILVGASYGWLAEIMFERGLISPQITNSRARFYFTEFGWEQVGRYVAAEAKRLGHVIKVIKRKEPERSQIVYRDKLQVALLPKKQKAVS